jgi:hypothetical protein
VGFVLHYIKINKMEIREDYNQEELDKLKNYLDSTDEDEAMDDSDIEAFMQNMFGITMDEYSSTIENVMKSNI